MTETVKELESSAKPGPQQASRVAQSVLEDGGFLRLARGPLSERARDLLYPEALLRRGHRHLARVELPLAARELLEGLRGERPEAAGRVGDGAPSQDRGQAGEHLHPLRPPEHR